MVFCIAAMVIKADEAHYCPVLIERAAWPLLQGHGHLSCFLCHGGRWISVSREGDRMILCETYPTVVPLVYLHNSIGISTQQLDRTDEGRTHDGQPRYSTVHDL